MNNETYVLDLQKNRRSIRAFSDKTIEKEKIEKILEAGRWAPSAMNEQPWRFIYAFKNQDESYKKIFSALAEGNQIWASSAPVLLVVIAKTKYDYNGAENKHAWYDVGQAMGAISLQATEAGIYLHQIGGFSPEKIKEAFPLPEGYEPVVVFAAGYKGNPDFLPDNLKVRETAEKQRKPLDELVFKF